MGIATMTAGTTAPVRPSAGLDGRLLPDSGRACHALVVPLPAPVRAGSVDRRLAVAAGRWPVVRGVRLWTTTVPGPPGGPAAVERVRREAFRPVRGALRAVLLCHDGGGATLVLVADRGEVPRAVLDDIAQITRAGEPPAVTVPRPRAAAGPARRWPTVEWGLGDPGRAGIAYALPLTVPGGDERLLLGALVLTLARYAADEPTVAFGHGDAVLRVDRPDEAGEPAGFLAGLPGRAVPGRAGETPVAGVVVCEPANGSTYLPFLAPAFPVTLQLTRGEPAAACWFDEGSVAPGVAAAFRDCVARAAAGLAAGAAALADIPLLDEVAEAAVRRLGDGGAVPASSPRGRIDELFTEVARAQPNAVAVTDERAELTYAELDARAGAIAAGLRAAGAEPGTLVGLCLDRDVSLVVAMLGILRAGCAYVPMDRRYPAERLRYTTENARVRIVVGDPGTFPAVDGVRVLPVSGLIGDSPPPGTGDDSAPAYVIYTSGSTGRPKGVVVPHRNVAALLAATRHDFGLSAGDTWTLFHSSAFDFSVWEVWGCLLTGGRLVVVPHWITRDTEEFHRLLDRCRVTVLNQTPSAFAQLVRADADSSARLAVRLVIFGGEPLDVALLGSWFARHSPSACRVVNMFGITETTVHVTAQDITPAEVVTGSRSVGRALPGWSLTVRDPAGRLLPPGPAGEIHVGGAGVAAGYLHRPELTAQRFAGGGYRSGDKGQLHPDGRLDHLGRLDDQVKIRGHRIELGEIRSVLAADPAVSAAVVVVRQGTPGDPAGSRIDAYVVPAAGAVSPGEVLANARRILPDYMVPSTVTEIVAVPLTENGKPDLARLPAPRRTTQPPARSSARSAEGPAADGPAAAVLRIWGDFLGAAVTLDDNFFEMGGNSLLVIQVLAAMREQGLPRVQARDFYANSTAGRFVALVEEIAGAAEV